MNSPRPPSRNANMSGRGNFQPPSRPASSSPRPLPRIIMTEDKQPYYSQFQCPQEYISSLPRILLHNSKAFSLPQTTPLSSRSPSVASRCSFDYDSDYDDGLIIEELDSDDENLDDNVEFLEGEYEDPPSDDDEYWDRWRHRQALNNSQNMILNEMEVLSTSVNSPIPITPAFMSPFHRYSPQTSPASSAGSKRSFADSDTDEAETDKEDKSGANGRRTRRRLIPKSTPSLRTFMPSRVVDGYHVPSFREFEMEE